MQSRNKTDSKKPLPRDPRDGWEESIRRLPAAGGDDELLLPDVGMTTWEDEEWEW